MSGPESAREGVSESARAIVVLLLRLYLGLALFLPLGARKLVAFPDSSAGMVERFSGTILGTTPLLPTLYAFSYLLPFWETLGAIALIVGYRTRTAFAVMAGLLVLLGFGSTLEMKIGTTLNNVVFMSVACWGLLWSGHDRWGLSAWRDRTSAGRPAAQ